nr:DUF882 domain-containing protein [Martelella endophytica]
MVATVFLTLGGAEARAETRTLKIYYVHTGERAEITFKRNGRYDKKGLEQLNWFLRDWRHSEPTNMDPRLFDLVWEVYQKVGAKDYINVVSAYRSPATNSMLRKNTSGVAKNSQHIQGKAMDFFIPGVPLAKLRATAMQMQRGGVGYYPTSGSPFVHLDVASVRAWPRMSRSQLAAIFPEGHTLHIPSDGKPLPGYSEALAEYKAKGSVGSSAPVAVASTEDGDEDERPNLLAMLFGGRDKGGNDEAPTPRASPRTAAPSRTAPAVEPAQRPVDILTAAVSFDDLDIPLPLSRPGAADADLGTPLATALVDPTPPVAEVVSTPEALLAANIPLPQARPASLGDGVSVADVLVADAAAPVEASPVEVAALDDGAGDAPFDLMDNNNVPVPSPRLAYAATTSSGTSIDPVASQSVLAVATPRPDPRRSAHAELASKLDTMGNTTEVAVNEADDFRAQFRPTAARINAAAPDYPVKGARPTEAILVSFNSTSSPITGNASSKNLAAKPSQSRDGTSLVESNKEETEKLSIVEYFDKSRF